MYQIQQVHRTAETIEMQQIQRDAPDIADIQQLYNSYNRFAPSIADKQQLGAADDNVESVNYRADYGLQEKIIKNMTLQGTPSHPKS